MKIRLLGLFAVLLLALAACGGPHEFQGTVLDPPTQVDDFALTGPNQQPFQISAQRGKVVVLFFGFTSCPDVCPTTLADLAEVRRKLGNDGDALQVAMVTVDPERDTPERLQKYTASFDPSFVGLYGSQAQLDAVYKTYGVTAIKRELPESQLGYTIDHSTYIYLIDRQGRWREVFGSATNTEAVTSDIRYLIRNS